MEAIVAGDKRSVRRAVCLSIFLAAVFASIIVSLVYPLPPVENDAADYLHLARNIAAGKGFTRDGVAPAVYRPPMFSTLLGCWFLLTGTTSPLSSAVFQSLEHGTAAALAFLLFLELTPSLAWAAAAGLFLAVNPLLATRASFVLQEPTILLFTTLAAWLSVRFLREPSRLRAALAGGAWGLCTLAKVVAGFGPFLLLAMRLLPGRVGGRGRRAEAVVLLLCFAGALAPWTIRNYIHFGRIIPVNAQGEGMLEWNVSHAEIPGEPPGAVFIAEVDRKGLPEGNRKTLLWRYVMDRPAYFFGTRVLGNALRFANPHRSWWWARGMYGPGDRRPWYWTAYDFLHRFLFLCLLYRAVQAARGRSSLPSAFIVFFACTYWALYAITWGEGRFALPIYPLLAAAAIPWGVVPR